MNTFYTVYILSNIENDRFHIGVTDHLIHRIRMHKDGLGTPFTRRYQVNRLVFFESTMNATCALKREAQIKSWPPHRLGQLIDEINPRRLDLSLTWVRHGAGWQTNR